MPDHDSTTANTWTVRRVLEWTTAHLADRGSESPRLDAEVLLAHARGCQRIELYTRFEEPLSDAQRSVMRDLVRRRAQAEPVAYLVGHREFYSLDFRVTSDVFIPRPETESLVMEALQRAKTYDRPRFLDVGTGSGCIAISLAANSPQGRVVAIDLHAPALEIARENAAAHRVLDRVEFRHGDLFAELSRDERFDLIVSNPPYVAEADMETLQPDVRQHEPREALLGGRDGLDIIRRLVETAPCHLTAGGHLLMEISPEQAEPVQQLMQANRAYADCDVLADLGGRKRVVGARLGE